MANYPHNRFVSRYSGVGRFSATTETGVSEYKDVYLTTKTNFQPDANGTRFIGRMGFLWGGEFRTTATGLGNVTTKTSFAPVGVLMAPDYIDACDPAPDLKNWVPSNLQPHQGSSNEKIVAGHPVMTRGVIPVYVANAESYKPGDLVCFKSGDFADGGGELKILPISYTDTLPTVPDGYIATSARVWDTTPIGDWYVSSDILWIQILDNQSITYVINSTKK